MPELPEVETVVRMLQQHLQGRTITTARVHRHDLRWSINHDFHHRVAQQQVVKIFRRAKYIVLELNHGVIIMHLGMTGQLKLNAQHHQRAKHDHVEFFLDNEQVMRFCDTRRFGSVLWFKQLEDDKRLHRLGVEPLAAEFNDRYLMTALANKRRAIKQIIMDNHIVVGVGNIYANESLFLSGIRPDALGENISPEHVELLVHAIKKVLQKAIKSGGTTLNDFIHLDGKAGYFKQHLWVYGRGNQPCLKCDTLLKSQKISGRQTVFCPGCQQ